MKINTNEVCHMTNKAAMPISRLAKRREILIFPRTAGNTGNSRELLVIPGNYWEIRYSLTKKLLIHLLTAIQLYFQCKTI